MKWFRGRINQRNKDITFCKGIDERINEYYGRKMLGKKSDWFSGNLVYQEFCNNEQSLAYETDKIVILGNVEIDYLPDDFESAYTYIDYLYRMHQTDFTKYLYGSFSIVIYDKVRELVFLVRDQFGLDQLFYTKEEGAIVFANQLFLLDDYYDATEIQNEYIEKFINFNGICSFSATPYKNIQRVEAAKYVEYHLIEGRDVRRTYWNLKDIPMQSFIPYENAKERFRQLLTDSIRNNIRRADKVGLMLSGGLDSTVLYALSDREKVCAYSAVFDELESCDEKEYINYTAKMYDNAKIEYVKCDSAGFFADYPDSYFYTTEPHLNCINKRFSENLFEKACVDNTSYILDGFLADHILSGNIVYMLDDLKLTKILKNYKIIREYATYRNMSFWEVLLGELVSAKRNKYFIPQISPQITSAYREDLEELSRFNGKEIIVQIQSSLARNYGDWELAPRYSLEVRHPYVDRKIIEFLYSLPGEMLMQRGEPKSLVKDTFYYDIPKQIRERVCKTQHVELSHKGIRETWNKVFPIIKEGLITNINCISIDRDEWVSMLNKFRAGQEFNDKILLYIALEIWCQSVVRRYGTISFIN